MDDAARLDAPRSRAGRRRTTSRAELEHMAFRLFDERGFDETTVDDIAKAAGIGRRTFFRYFPSKNDVVWGDFESQLGRMREELAACPSDRPLIDALRVVMMEFNRVDSEEVPWLRRRMRFILEVPALQAHSTLRYAAWRKILAEFIGERLGRPPGHLTPQTISYACLGAAIAAYEQWLRDDDADLLVLLDASMRALATAFDSPAAAPAGSARST